MKRSSQHYLVGNRPATTRQQAKRQSHNRHAFPGYLVLENMVLSRSHRSHQRKTGVAFGIPSWLGKRAHVRLHIPQTGNSSRPRKSESTKTKGCYRLTDNCNFARNTGFKKRKLSTGRLPLRQAGVRPMKVPKAHAKSRLPGDCRKPFASKTWIKNPYYESCSG